MASLDQAEAAYHRLLRIHHPDLHQEGGAHELAAAEARTRALNAAIAQVRALHAAEAFADSLVERVHRDPRTFDDGTHSENDTAGAAPGSGSGSGGPGGPGSGSGGSAGGSATWASATSASEWASPWASAPGPHGRPHSRPYCDVSTERRYTNHGYYGDKPITVPCPFCGQDFSVSEDLKRHVSEIHAVRVDPRPRRPRAQRRGGWLNAIFASLSLLIPLNAGIALVIGAIVNNVVDDLQLTYWVVAICMAPTLIRILDGGFTHRDP
jgi:uncharacterized C2H2 Zn-finger protein